MPNKRDLKKSIDAVGSSLVEEMTVAFYNVEGADKDLISQAVSKVLGAMTVARDAVNHYFGKGMKEFESHEAYAKAKAAFAKKNMNDVIEKFNEGIHSALQDFNKALPEDYKNANKQAVSK